MGDTDQALAWRPDLSVALNAVDFRGGLPFVYYHQVRVRVRVRVRARARVRVRVRVRVRLRLRVP